MADCFELTESRIEMLAAQLDPTLKCCAIVSCEIRWDGKFFKNSELLLSRSQFQIKSLPRTVVEVESCVKFHVAELFLSVRWAKTSIWTDVSGLFVIIVDAGVESESEVDFRSRAVTWLGKRDVMAAANMALASGCRVEDGRGWEDWWNSGAGKGLSLNDHICLMGECLVSEKGPDYQTLRCSCFSIWKLWEGWFFSS